MAHAGAPSQLVPRAPHRGGREEEGAGASRGQPCRALLRRSPGRAGDCSGADVLKGNAIRPQGWTAGEHILPVENWRRGPLPRSGQRPSQRSCVWDGNVAIWLPSRPVKQGDVVTVHVTVASNATVDFFILR